VRFHFGPIPICYQSSQAEAYQVKRVFSGSVIIGSTEEIKEIDVSGYLGGVPLELSKSIILVSQRSDETAARTETDFMAIIDDPQKLLLPAVTGQYGHG